MEIAEELGLNRHTCRLWRERFMRDGAQSCWEVAEGRGRKSQAGLAQRIVEATVGSQPEGQTHWSSMGSALIAKSQFFCLTRGPAILNRMVRK